MSVVAVVGPTASGKSLVAERLAEQSGAVIISVDSMQVYRGMDIGTAKPSPSVRAHIPHRMVDIVDPSDDLTVAEFQAIGRRAIEAAEESHGRVVIAGGSGLHFRALVDPLSFAPTDPEVRSQLEALSADDAVEQLLAIDPTAGDHIDLANPRRVIRALEIHALTDQSPIQRHTSAEAQAVRSYQALVPFDGFGVDAGPTIGDRVRVRFAGMLDEGLLSEVERLAPIMGRAAAQAVGYKELLPVVRGAAELSDAAEGAVRATLALVKRQRTFFRRDPRIRWCSWEDEAVHGVDDIVQLIRETAGWTS